jgi:hypothetical protein
MLEKEQSDLHVIINDSPEPPRLIVIPKSQLRRMTVAAPLVLVMLGALLLAVVWWQGPRRGARLPSLPAFKPDSRILELEQETASLRSSLKSMQQKLAAPGAGAAEVWLGPVRKPFAFQDLTSKQTLRIEDVSLKSSSGKQSLHFNLVNAGSSKITGHFFVVQNFENSQAIFPSPSSESWGQGMRFDSGETFSVSRLRPVDVTFPEASTARFMVLVFNREGDLLLRQELTAPFAGGASGN